MEHRDAAGNLRRRPAICPQLTLQSTRPGFEERAGHKFDQVCHPWGHCSFELSFRCPFSFSCSPKTGEAYRCRGCPVFNPRPDSIRFAPV